MKCLTLSAVWILFTISACLGQINPGMSILKQKPSGLAKTSALSYCSYVGMYIFAQDQNSQYLGYVTDNEYNTESIINDYGTYGSQYSAKSIRNEYSSYGSPYSTYSAYNEYTSTPPIIYSYSSVTGKYTAIAYLTKNVYKTPAVDPDLLIATLKVGCSTPPPTNVRDLLIDSLTCYAVGDSIRVRFIALNSGNLDISTPFKIGLYNNGTLLTYWNPTTSLSAGYYYTLNYSFKPTVQTNTIKAFVDYDNLVTEDYEYNNTLSKTVYASVANDTIDLKIDSLHLLLSHDTLWLAFNMLNNGNTTIQKGIKSAIYLNGVLDLTTDSTTDLLPPKYYYPYSFYITRFSSATMRIRVCVDATNKVVEFRENNNCDSGTISVPYTGLRPATIGTSQHQSNFSIFGRSIVLRNVDSKIEILITDMQGRSIHTYSIEKPGYQVLELPSSLYSNGSYICTIRKNGVVMNRRLLTMVK